MTMQLTLMVLFWFSIVVLAWTYVGYPLCVKLLARRVAAVEDAALTEYPLVSIVVAVHNEAEQLAAKLENLASLDYPRDKLEFIVVCDGSDELTQRSAQSFFDQRCGREISENVWPPKDGSFPGILIVKREQEGKPAALNAGVARARGELVMCCDVRQCLARDACRALAATFLDPAVGVASGALVMSSARGPGMYWRYERAIREAEARLDSTVGVTGALYMIRRELFPVIPRDCLLDDVYVPLQVSLRGYRVVFAPKAEAYDQESAMSREFQRKARTLAGNFQLIEMIPDSIKPWKNRLFLQFVSHKLLRLMCPYALVVLVLTSLALAQTGTSTAFFYGVFFVCQLICYAAAIAGGVWQLPGFAGSFVRLCRTFVVLNAAAVMGFYRYLQRDYTWTR